MRFAQIERACIPAAAMSRLAPLRACRDLEVALAGRELWLRWSDSEAPIAETLFAIPGCRLFVHDEEWRENGRHLPAFDMPKSLAFRPLSQVILPGTFEPTGAADFAPRPMRLTLVPDSTYRPSLAVECSIDAFLAWALSVPACRLARYRAAVAGERLFVLGKSLPWIDGGERFWGRSVLVPVGFRPRPLFPEAAMRTLLGVADSDLVVVRETGCELIAEDRFTPVSHAALRLARKEAAR
jgi:hypothetical protein